MNKYLLYLKNPKILGMILLLIVVIIAIVAIIISLNSKTSSSPPPPPLCKGNKIPITCNNGSIQCGDICKGDQKWDCNATGANGNGACVCKNSAFKLCNGNSECCACYPDDMCCKSDTQGSIKDPKTGNLIKICCPPDTTPGDTGEGCLSSNCGTSKIPCSQGQACMKITGLTTTDFTAAVTHTQNDGTYRSDDGSTLYLCANPTSCGFISSSAEYLPYNSNGASSYYNTSIMQDGDNICIPNDPTQYGSSGSVCYTSDQQSNCSNQDCIKKSSFDIFREENGGSTLAEHMKIIMGQQGKSEQGYYCSNGGDPFLQYESITGDGTCKWQDCHIQLEEPGMIRIQWDDNIKKCSALKSNSDVGSRGAVKCTGAGVPCADCTGPTGFSNCVKCTGAGKPCISCEKAETYISDSLCERRLWKFEQCKNDPDKVLSSFAPSGKTCDNVTCGNCPWGDNSTILSFGSSRQKCGLENESQYVCVNDNQIRLYDPTPTMDCDDTQVLNNSGDTCIYACTMDGTDAKKKDTNEEEDVIKKIFTAQKFEGDDTIYCFRTPLDDTIVGNMCTIEDDFFGTSMCTKVADSDSFDYLTKNDYIYADNPDKMCADLRNPDMLSNYWHDCAIDLVDNIQKFDAVEDLNPPVIYLYPTDKSDWKRHGESSAFTPDGQAISCWSSSAPNSFWYPTNEPSSRAMSHPKLIKVKNEFCTPLNFKLPNR